jgi:glycine/D-amino acid oxidase-like deaminating enzyme
MQAQGTCTVLIPPELLDPLRDGLFSQIAVAAQDIVSADEQMDARAHLERYQDALRYMDAVRALLEEIGWSSPPSDPRVDPQIHGWALTEALRDQIDAHADMLRDIPQDGERRAAIARDMAGLTSLALTVLLKVQAQNLRAGLPSTSHHMI